MGWPGSAAAVQQLVDEHYADLYRYAYRLAGSAADAEDLTQEAFCQAQLKLGQLRDRARARSWLFTIVRNAFLHRARSDRQRRHVSLDSVGDVPGPTPDPLPDVDPEKLRLALEELPEGFRTPVVLFYFEEFSYREIAEQLRLPIGTVMSRLARGKAHLRARLFPPEPLPLADGPRRATDGL